MSSSSEAPQAMQNRCPACGGQVVLAGHDLSGDSPCPHCRSLLWFVERRVGQVTVATFLPGLIAGSESVMRVGEVLSVAGSPPRLVLNLAHLRVISSVFLAMLVGVQKRVTAAGGAMKICGVEPVGFDAIRVARLDTLLSIVADESAALAAF